MRFQEKIAIVTGGASGMGKEVASRFVAEGGSVIVNGRDTAKTEAAAYQIDPSGKRAVGYVGNVALPAVGEALVKTAIDRFGRLDVLFNNAGIFGPKPFLEVTEAEYDRFLDNILKDAFFTAQAAAKATGHAQTRNLAIESAPYKTRVNAIAPAVIETPVFNTFLSPEQVAAVLPTFNAMHPLGRNGQPADAADALLFLASDQASFITGVVLPVDGGVMAGRQ